jgi:hypothetical protein
MPSPRQGRTIRRYSAYFRNWAQAFGNHDKLGDEGAPLRWLIGEQQVGLILTPEIRRILYPRLLGRHGEAPPRVQLGRKRLVIDELTIPFADDHRPAVDAVMELFSTDGELHLSQTYHLIYPGGTRILTLGRHAPMPLIYREIEPLGVDLLD